ncbi:protein of unknown function DUF86 [Candidatus Koribacter versatilis Ellin345]|uniref:DUF86 domain-containing protein n=1 Tax=Koribacter versatilis (strain Ellin345) TaxID=204669 RepID=Q1IQ80_KORVE|nr:DUF86 domain-containing protein [Candidatus Koribacter versatilis]ABF40970.1 protein of unknown function DUF86 [Candidatus Koribacter versatilis Ellin345]
MRHDRAYLADIIEACQHIGSFVSGRDLADLDSDVLLRSGIFHQLAVIGEAASRISTELRDRHPELAWRQISGMRNYIAHAYFSLDLRIVWETATMDVPNLRITVLRLSDAEFGHDDVIQ